jgi:hypothetical protein
MGLLDDAIREHLELKRRHGADPGEVAQLEREAFGPARRGPEPLEVPPEPAEPEPQLEVVPEPVAEEAEPAPAPAPDVADPVLIEPEVDAPVYEPPDVEPEPELEAVPPPPAPPEGAEPEAEGEDVLEETPEFLQETPEHDRLWFEQRPPRDFDFDG